MDSNKNRQCRYGEGEYGINWVQGLVVLLIALALASVVLAGMGG